MEDIRNVIMDHFTRHPAMRIEDFVKLLYQNAFGPGHFSTNPVLNDVKAYLEKELELTEKDIRSEAAEDVGGGFLRVPLACVHAGMVSADALATAFLQSMERPIDVGSARQAFTANLAVLAAMIRAGTFGLPVEESLAALSDYLANGIRPTHHSIVYNQTYSPHYRLIHETTMPEGVSMMKNRVYVKPTRFKGFAQNPSLLGFGCMRLPTLSKDKPDIDETLAQQMIDFAYAHGVTYYDTAYPYHHGLSETFIGKALKKYPRASFRLATKMPGWLVHSRADAEKYFHEQLGKCQVDYFDFYLCHALGEENFKAYQIPGVMDFLDEMKAAGKIRHLGFSFHDQPEMLDRIIHAHAWDFVQLQLNYLDWNFQDAKKQYDIVEKYGVPCIVMEPVRGGLLATLSDEAAAIFKAADPAASVASWAIRYAASKPNTMVVLSGMSNSEQVEDNIATMSAFRPLDRKDEAVIARALASFMKNRMIPCTACGYCMPCPHGVDIPRLFRIQNEYSLSKWKRDFIESYEDVPAEHRADRCVRCSECLTHCPQKIDIPDRIEEIATLYATLKQESGKGMRVVNCYREKMPATRFIGRRFGDEDRNEFGGFGSKWGEWFAQGLFEPLKGLSRNTPEGSAYIGLMRCVPKFQYWIGVFCPADTAMPAGYQSVDIPAMDLAVSWVKGKEENGEIYGVKPLEASIAAGRAKGLLPVEHGWYFKRYCDGRFMPSDAAGEVILDYCIEITPEPNR